MGGYVGHGDTNERPERQWPYSPNILLLLACLIILAATALPACQVAKSKALIDAPDPCDPAKDRERCEPSIDGIRQLCDAATKQWLTVAYCPSGECKELPAVDDASSDSSSGVSTVCAPKAQGSGNSDAKGGTSYWQGGSSGAGGSGGDTTSETADSTGSSVACGDGLCSSDESPDSCPADCAAQCGDSLCTKGEDGGTCAWDCVAGAQAGAQCMIAKCPGAGLQCKASSTCAVVLAQVWACAQGCSGCLSTCLAQAGADSVVFSVASCSAAACLATN